ncbi:UNVERIFIED_CONTAM: Dimethylnonatriene synthase [Sesamum calycinum]|uniref:Dimethylnonatriene synthase n=1 Tax=Sesamum calycinum TaxID=2727403 RepID=A0AAW2M068_9LAMI
MPLMAISSWALPCIALVAFLYRTLYRKQPFPPGPKPWPIIGNLNLVGSIPYQSPHFLFQKYGEIMQLKFGTLPVVVASSPEMAKQFLRVHNAVFASRPALSAGQPVVLRDHLSRFSVSNMSRMVFSNKYFDTESEDEKAIMNVDELRGMLDEWLFLGGVFNIGDWTPWLSCLDLQGYVKRMKALSKKLDRFYSFVLDDHLTRKAAGAEFIPEDVLDSLLQLAEDSNHEIKLTGEHVKALAQAKEELDRVIGRDRWVEEKDHSQLPYIDAIIMESMRLHPLATLLAPHYAMEDCKVAGYDVAKGTTVIINAWSLGRDPNSWDSPLEFLPERFLNKDIDITGSNFAMLPFGSGRRRCPGYDLGLKIVWTTLANLLHGFELKLIEGMKPEDVSLEEAYALTTHPKKPLTIIMEPTLSDHLY